MSVPSAENKEPVKDEKAYAKNGGGTDLIFRRGNTGYGTVAFVNLYVALAQIILCTIVFGVLWKRMNDKYGA